jgi:hypothetical protein
MQHCPWFIDEAACEHADEDVGDAGHVLQKLQKVEGVSAVRGRFRQQIFLTRSREERKGKSL